MVRKRNKIIPFTSSDKGFEEGWTKGRNMMFFPRPFRALFCGKNSVGKSRLAKNMIANSNFEKVFVLSEDPEGREYECCGAEMLQSLPEGDFWRRLASGKGGEEEDEEEEEEEEDEEEELEGKDKKPYLVIIDDVNFSKRFSGKNLDRINRLTGHYSSHHNISIIYCSQNFSEVPIICRRTSNIYNFWKPDDLDHLRLMGRRVGLTGNAMKDLFDNHCVDTHDSICFDKTSNTPFPIRKNMFQPLKLKKK